MRTIERRLAACAIAFILSYALFPAVSTTAKEGPAVASGAPFVLPSGRDGAEYSYRFNSEGGLAPLTWRVVQGELPPGLALRPTGILAGLPTPSRRQAYTFAVEVSDSSHPPQRFQQGFTLTINAAALRILPASSPLKILTSKESTVLAPLSHQDNTANTGDSSVSSGSGSNATPGEAKASAGNRSDVKADQPRKPDSRGGAGNPDTSKRDAGATPAGSASKIHPVIKGVVSLASMSRNPSGYTGSLPLTNAS